MDAKKATGQDSAREEVTELADHEARQVATVFILMTALEEGLEVVGQDPVESRILGSSATVARSVWSSCNHPAGD